MFPFWQFHILFNSLFRVLFIFPSRYLFAISLLPIFSFRWYLPPNLDSIPKLSDSEMTFSNSLQFITGFSPSMMKYSNKLKHCNCNKMSSLNYNSPENTGRLQSWAFPNSLAVTKGIPVGFFSSAYWYA